MSDEVVVRRVPVNGVELDVVEAGPPDGQAVVLAHGFPECAHSWRHQIGPLAAAGYRVLVPDQRGYGRSTAPRDVAAYGIDALCGDLLGLLDEAGADDAVFIGHDWGALVGWDLARLHPDRVRALVALSVPLVVWPDVPTVAMRRVFGDRFFYMLYFQDVGPAEAELEADVATTMRTILAAAPRRGGSVPNPSELPPMAGTGFLDVFPLPPAELPAWLAEADLDVYVDRFTASGFFGPVSWYRNLDANRERLLAFPADRIAMPVAFIGGADDPVIRPGAVEAMSAALPDLRLTELLPGIGHWVQQEAPGDVNRLLLGFLDSLAG